MTRPHTVWVQAYDVLGKNKTTETKKIGGCQGLGRRGHTWEQTLGGALGWSSS